MFEEKCKCETCPLRKSKEKFGCISGEAVGDYPPEVVMIGISPAKVELNQKRPMVGQSGQLGREVARKTGYTDYYITNTFQCWYPEDATELHIQKAAECCRPRLDAEIDYYKPKLTIGLGNVPVRSILGHHVSVLAIEGRIVDSVFGPFLPIRQPAQVLHNPDDFTEFKDAMKVGDKYLKGTYRSAAEPDTVIVTEDNIGEITEKIMKAPWVVIDLETTKSGFHPYGWDPDEIRCIALAIDEKIGYIVPKELIHHPNVYTIINNTKGVYHNAHFDCGFLFAAGFHPIAYYDTILAHFMLDERPYAHGLKLLARKILGAPDWEVDLKRYLPTSKASYDNIPDHVLFPYAARDVVYTYQIALEFMEEIKPEGEGLLAKLLMPCLNMFNEIRHEGILIDVEKLMEIDFDKVLQEMETELIKTTGRIINPNSSPDVAWLAYDYLKIPVSPKFGRSTSKKYLTAFKDLEPIALVLESREMKKLGGTYAKGMAKFIDKDFRIHPFTKLWGAITGRISTIDPSVMNIPRKGGIKEVFIPDPGHHMVNIDFSGVELRAYAAIMQDKYLIDMLKHGDLYPEEDIHNIVASEATQRAERLVTRGNAKTLVFGRMYKRGVPSIMRALGITRESAEELISFVDSMFPSLGRYNTIVENTVHTKGELVSWFGRRRRFGVITKEHTEEIYRQAVNFYVQSMASDVNLFCMLEMWKKRHEFGAKPLFPVHDSIMFDVEDISMIPVMVREMEEYATELGKNTVPFKVKAEVGQSWGQAEEMAILSEV